MNVMAMVIMFVVLAVLVLSGFVLISAGLVKKSSKLVLLGLGSLFFASVLMAIGSYIDKSLEGEVWLYGSVSILLVIIATFVAGRMSVTKKED